MFRECRHMMPTGRHCQSPAMRRSAYCYHHDRLRRRYGRPVPRKLVQLPPLDNREAVLKALNDVMNGMLSRKLDDRQVGRLLNGLQIAAGQLRRAPTPAKAKPVGTPAPAAPQSRSPVAPQSRSPVAPQSRSPAVP